MTREEAIEILKYLIPIPHRGDGKSTRHLLQTNALAMAIKALEQEPLDVSNMLNDIYMEGVNMTDDYQGLWVRFKDIETIVNKYAGVAE